MKKRLGLFVLAVLPLAGAAVMPNAYVGAYLGTELRMGRVNSLTDPVWDFTTQTGSSQSLYVHPPYGWKVSYWVKAVTSAWLQPATFVDGFCEKIETTATNYLWQHSTKFQYVAAKLDPLEYDIVFQAGNSAATGSTAALENLSFTNNAVRLSANGFALAGRAFKCWRETSPNTGFDFANRATVGGAALAVSNDQQTVILTAQWTNCIYAVSFNANGGTSAPADINVTYGGTYPALGTPTWAGHTFTGWYTAREDGTRIQAGNAVAITAPTTLYAHWTVNSYKLTLCVEGKGTLVPPAGESNHAYGEKVEVTASPEIGYLFAKWMEDGTTVNPKTVTISAASTLTAVFTARVSRVTFDANGGTSAPAAINVTYGGKYPALGTPTWAGHTFTGWYTAPDGGSRIQAGNAVAITAPTTLFAHWTLNSYKLALRVEGKGTLVPPAGEANYAYGEKVEVTATPETGYLFAKWKEDGTTSNPKTVTVSAASTLTAVFTAKVFRVAFTYRNPDRTTVTNYVSYGEAAVPPARDIVDCYPGNKFVRWEPQTYDSVKIDLDITAVYEGNQYWVKFEPNADDVSGAMNMQRMTCGDLQVLYANVYKRAGFAFAGWNTKADGSGTRYGDREQLKRDLSTVEGDIVTFYAQWVKREYRVAFDANGGEGQMQEQSIQCDISAPLQANAFVRTGYLFAGWSTNALGKVDLADRQSVRNLADDKQTVTLRAVWSAIRYSVRFNGNGATAGSMPDQTCRYDEESALNPNAFRRTSYAFDAWATRADGGGTRFDDKDPVLNLSTVDGAVVPLYAQWTLRQYGIAFDANGGTGEMTKQTVSCEELTSLSSNRFVRTGYTFLGWSRDAKATKPDFADQGSVKDLAEENQTARLYAVWEANTYYVAFDANGGLGDPMPVQRFVYDQPQSLVPYTYQEPSGGAGLFTYSGWSNLVAGVEYRDGATVSNLCDVANGTNVLMAIWGDSRTDESKWLGCVNLQWEQISFGKPWTNSTQGTGIRLEEQTSEAYCNALTTQISVNGVLRFKYRNLRSAAPNNVRVTWWAGRTTNITMNAGAEWQTAVCFVEAKGLTDLTIANANLMVPAFGGIELAQMTWTPCCHDATSILWTPESGGVSESEMGRDGDIWQWCRTCGRWASEAPGVDEMRPMYVICHGHADSIDAAWMRDMAEALPPDANVLAVNWSRSAKKAQPSESAAAISNVAVRVGECLRANGRILPEKTTFIGRGHGAHIVANAMADWTGEPVARFVGLDTSVTEDPSGVDRWSGTIKSRCHKVEFYKTSWTQSLPYEKAYGHYNFIVLGAGDSPESLLTLADDQDRQAFAAEWFTRTILDPARYAELGFNFAGDSQLLDQTGFCGLIREDALTVPVGCFVQFAGASALSPRYYDLDRVFQLPSPVGVPNFDGWAGSNGRRYDDGMLIFNLGRGGETITLTPIEK